MTTAAGSPAFRPFFGGVNPRVATIAVTGLSIASLISLASHRRLDIYRKETLRQGLLFSAIVAILLAVPVILVDVVVVFPADMNVLPPSSLLFYPVMADVAEC